MAYLASMYRSVTSMSCRANKSAPELRLTCFSTRLRNRVSKGWIYDVETLSSTSGRDSQAVANFVIRYEGRDAFFQCEGK